MNILAIDTCCSAATAAVLLATLAGYFLHWQIDGWGGFFRCVWKKPAATQ